MIGRGKGCFTYIVQFFESTLFCLGHPEEYHYQGYDVGTTEVESVK